jgi:hypothetical protein
MQWPKPTAKPVARRIINSGVVDDIFILYFEVKT